MGKMKNIKTPIFAIDFEGSKNIGIVEYGVAEIFGGRIRSCATRICAPKTAITPADAKFFDISDARARQNPPFIDDILSFCDMRKRGIFAAHNAVAEDTMLRDALPVAPPTFDELTGKTCASWSPFIDTCVLSKKLFGLKSSKLSDVVNALGLTAELDARAAEFCPTDRRKWHCALYDAIACALILIKICSFDGFENVSQLWLLKHSNPTVSTQETFL